MKRLTISILAVVLSAIPAASQQPNERKCNLSESNAPAIRGIRLGMSVDQLLDLFPGSRDRAGVRQALDAAKSPKGYDSAKLDFDLSQYPNLDGFAGVSTVRITTYKNQVRAFRVDYKPQYTDAAQPYWETVDQWIAKLSEAFGLPEAKDWIPNGDRYKILKCNEFEIEASNLNGAGAISLRNTRFGSELQKRVQAEADGKRKAFKP
jgi:hypothetical protein